MGSNLRVDPVVVKIGGSTLGSGDTTLQDLVELQLQGAPVVVVHGGGPIINQWVKNTGVRSRFVRGLRVTDDPTMEVVLAVLAGLVNKRLVAAIQRLGGEAVGVSGVDGRLIQARVRDPEMGLVGEIVDVRTHVVDRILEDGFMPIVAPVALSEGVDSSEETAILNVNGDTVAGELAAALKAKCLIFLTDVEGVRDSTGRVIPRLLSAQARALIQGGVASGGMIPKLEACLTALSQVTKTSIVDGRKPRALTEYLSGVELGTRVG